MYMYMYMYIGFNRLLKCCMLFSAGCCGFRVVSGLLMAYCRVLQGIWCGVVP